MIWYGDHMNGWGYGLMGVSMVLFWAALIVGGLALFRSLNPPPNLRSEPAHRPPEEMLAERYARGDIDDDEYRQRQEALRARGQNAAARL